MTAAKKAVTKVPGGTKNRTKAAIGPAGRATKPEAASSIRSTATKTFSGGGHLEARLWLRMLSCVGLVEQELRNRLRRDFDLTLARFDVLTQLVRPPENPTMSELSHRLMVTKGSITDVVGRLEASGLVARRRDERDSRIQRVHLTRKGQKLVNALIPAHHAWLGELFGGSGREDLQELDRLLGQMRLLLRPEPPA